jgi:hypothetical protein
MNFKFKISINVIGSYYDFTIIAENIFLNLFDFCVLLFVISITYAHIWISLPN